MTGTDRTGTRRRNVLKYIGTTGAIGLAGCLRGGPSGSDGGQPFYPHTIWGMFGSWENAYVSGGRFYARDHDLDFENFNSRMEEQTQISHIQSFVQQDADGILIGPVSATAPINAVENAASEGIPVMAANSEINTPELTMSVYIGNEPACERVGNEMVRYLTDEVSPSGAAEGTVINIQGDLGMSIGASRNRGFMNAVEGHDGITVLEGRSNFSLEKAQENTFSLLQKEDGEVDALFAASGAMADGATNALERFGKEPGDVFVGCMDGSPTVIDLFDAGWVQAGFAQPTQFYLPLALYFQEQLRTEGEGAIPEPGTELTTDDFEITGNKHLGVDIWKGQSWAPAQVKERDGHAWLQTNGKLLTVDNYEDPSNWGQIFGAADV